MTNRLDLVIDNFREYIRSIRVSNIDDEIEVEYTLFAYDYIDDDLDFNEEYYAGLCNHFQRWLESTATDVVKQKEVRLVRLIQNRMLFRNTDEHVQTITYQLKSASGGEYLSTIKETIEPVGG